MPASLNGCGTMYYGRRGATADGSFITTLWITLVYVPLLPLRTYRVRSVGQGANYFFYRSQQYRASPVALCGKQILNVYAVLGAVVIFIVLLVEAIARWMSG